MYNLKARIIIPLLVVTAVIAYCWFNFVTTDNHPGWRHYVGITSYTAIVFLVFVKPKAVSYCLGIYLMVETFNLLAIRPEIATTWFGISPLTTPPLQLSSLAILVLFRSLNATAIINYYLDSKEQKMYANKLPGLLVKPVSKLPCKQSSGPGVCGFARAGCKR